MLARRSLSCLYTWSIDLTKSSLPKFPCRSGRKRRIRDLILASSNSPFALIARTDRIENGSSGKPFTLSMSRSYTSCDDCTHVSLVWAWRGPHNIGTVIGSDDCTINQEKGCASIRITHMTKCMTERILVVHTRHCLFELNEITNSGFILCPCYEFGFLPIGE